MLIVRLKTTGILKIGWPISDIRVEVDTTSELNWILTDESAGLWIVISGAVVVEAGFRVELSSRVTEIVHNAARSGDDVAKGIVIVIGGWRTVDALRQFRVAFPLRFLQRVGSCGMRYRRLRKLK